MANDMIANNATQDVHFPSLLMIDLLKPTRTWNRSIMHVSQIDLTTVCKISFISKQNVSKEYGYSANDQLQTHKIPHECRSHFHVVPDAVSDR